METIEAETNNVFILSMCFCVETLSVRRHREMPLECVNVAQHINAVNVEQQTPTIDPINLPSFRKIVRFGLLVRGWQAAIAIPYVTYERLVNFFFISLSLLMWFTWALITWSHREVLISAQHAQSQSILNSTMRINWPPIYSLLRLTPHTRIVFWAVG